jgi:predicted dehydrogenase
MKLKHSFQRREFLRRASVGAAALAAGAWSVRAQTSPGANERLGVGFIGTGDRGTQLLRELLGLAGKCNVQVTAVCDVWRKNREAAAERVKQGSGSAPRQFTRFPELLAAADVDAVVIATPDFSHGAILVAALEAGKDVYVEKPMTIDVASANRAFDLARAKNRVVQAGTQRRSDAHFLGAAKFVATGALGKLSRITGAMNVNSPRWARRFDDCRAEDVDWEAFCLGRIRRAFDPRLLRCWQLFCDTTNGIPGLWMTHYADAVHMISGARYPAAAVALGGVYVWPDGREHADTFHALLEYPEGFLFDWGMGLGNAAGVHFAAHGTKGTLDLEKWTFTPEGTRTAPAEPAKVPGEPTVGHMENWLQCLRSRAWPNADIRFGHQHAVATIMTATAAETGRRQKWDPAKRELFAA